MVVDSVYGGEFTASSAAAIASYAALLLVVLIPLLATPAEAQSYEYQSSYDHDWDPAYQRQQQWGRPRAQRRTLWQTARSLMPRFADVAYETASSFSLPAIALITLFVLWPEHKHYRTKRDTGDSEDESTDQLAQHLGRIFAAAVEGDECMQRVACEIGAVTSSSLHPSHKKLVTRLVTSLAPAKYTTLLKTFKTGATTARCDKHACALLHLQQ
ncbi:uncharacterized protein LOC123508897 isoform X1 [Portunus trituberculatus]|uniref:uncharacterized protein LOC123508897 isoform X1 n=1 Tax=Portunus trituberculatus TaxID=210409 RepID=UPI001E1D16BA|nr:uncharacterized protein LOC123508897 isoform X1 [Portunus trituberculatus]